MLQHHKPPILRNRPIRRRRAAAWLLSVCLCAVSSTTAIAQSEQAPAQSANRTVRVSVLSLFHPSQLILRPVQGTRLTVNLDGQTRILSGSEAAMVIRSFQAQERLSVQSESESSRIGAGLLLAHPEDQSLAGDSPRFWLEVPGKLRRQYAGDLEIRARNRKLEAVVVMPMETAVASIVEAESPPSAAIEALKAQAVAARSFLAARQTAHTGFDFCDTTHCQFLRSPPAANSRAAAAAQATRGLILTWHDADNPDEAQDRPLAALYARSCGGLTRTLRQIGVATSGYPYYPVHCTYCARHPEIWKRNFSAASLPGSTTGAASLPRTEQDRLRFNRIHGWGAIPGNIADAQTSEEPTDRSTHLSGRGIGHGVGLCQLGAADMARRGSTFTRILAHYYPNTRLASLP